MPKVSLILLCDKLGGFDIFSQGILQQSFKDFEIIIVDELYYTRRNEVIPFLIDAGIEQDIIHTPIHVKACNHPCNLASAYNTGITHARTDCIITMCDYMVLPRNYIELHYKYYKQYNGKACVSGIKCQAKAPLYYTDGFKVLKPINIKKPLLRTWKPGYKFDVSDYILYGFEPPISLADRKVKLEDLTHGPPAIGNDMMSYPLQAWLDVNGYYEELDKYFEMMAWETTLRMMLAGYEVYTTSKIMAYHIPHKQRQTSGRGYFGPEIPNRMRGLLEGKINYKAPNPYNLREKRAEILGL